MWARLRLILCLLWPAALFPFALATRLPGFFGAPVLSLRLGASLQRVWARGTLALMGVRVESTGAPPRGPFLIVANHSSYLDILVLAALFPGRFVAKSEIAGWPLVGWMSRAVGTLFVRQARRRDVVRVGEEISRTLAAGVNAVLFPEGRASRGDVLGSFHTSLFEPAAAERTPCLAVALTYETPSEPAGPAWTVAWWGGMDLPRHVKRLVALRGGVRARVAWASAVSRGTNRKALAAEVHAALAELFVPLRQLPVPADLPWPELVSADAGARRGKSVSNPTESPTKP